MLEAIAQSAAASLADRSGLVRRCAGESCSLFFTDDSPNRAAAGATRRVRRRDQGRAAPRAAALTATEPCRYFERTQEALGRRYRLERTVARFDGRVLFEAYD